MEEKKEKKTTGELFFTWTKTDLIQTAMFVGWIACVCWLISGKHWLAGIPVGLVVAINYSFLAIYHVNSINAEGGDRVKNVALIYLAPSVFMAILALLSVLHHGAPSGS